MRTNHQAAVVYLRMTPQLRDALRAAADQAGTSLNAFAVQVLAAAAGDPARFRVGTEGSVRPGDVEIKRDERGFPLSEHEERKHRLARDEFLNAVTREQGSAVAHPLVRRLDVEDPGYFVRWKQERLAERRSAEGEVSRRDGSGAGARG